MVFLSESESERPPTRPDRQTADAHTQQHSVTLSLCNPLYLAAAATDAAAAATDGALVDDVAVWPRGAAFEPAKALLRIHGLNRHRRCYCHCTQCSTQYQLRCGTLQRLRSLL